MELPVDLQELGTPGPPSSSQHPGSLEFLTERREGLHNRDFPGVITLIADAPLLTHLSMLQQIVIGPGLIGIPYAVSWA